MRFCSDNGIVEEGISQSPQEVTAICAKNIAAGSTAVGRMAHLTGCAIQVLDLGINTNEVLPGVIDKKLQWEQKFLSRRCHDSTADETGNAMRHGCSVCVQAGTAGFCLHWRDGNWKYDDKQRNCLCYAASRSFTGSWAWSRA